MNVLKLLLLASFITCAPTANDLDLVQQPHSQQKSYVELPQPIKSHNDPAEYKVFQLNNGMKVMIVLRSLSLNSVSLDVSIGSFNDPEDLLGAAHLLEHLLCLATDKHPGRGDYNDLISKHGGTIDASTKSEYTNYTFYTHNSGVMEALERFSEFFKCPLINKECVDTAIRAINQEYEMKEYDISRIIFHILQEKAFPSHPIHKFIVGNRDTLNKEGNDEMMREFFKENYSADKMNLVISWDKDIDEIMDKVVKHFGSIPRRKTKEMINDENPFSEEVLGPIPYVQ